MKTIGISNQTYAKLVQVKADLLLDGDERKLTFDAIVDLALDCIRGKK
ncbi:MAG: hypothetical protein AAB355_00235 [Patescibacteria group bacterium]